MKYFVFSFLGGMLLYIPFQASFYTFAVLDTLLWPFYCLLYYLLGGFIVFFCIAHKTQTIKCAFWRECGLLAGIVLAIELGAGFRVSTYIDQLLGIDLNEIAGNVAGIATAYWILTMVVVSFATKITILIKQKIRKT